MRFLKHPAFLLSLVVILGLGIRLGLAYHPGYEFDVGTNQGWGRSVVINGLTSAYVEQVDGTMIPNYPPFSLMVFGASAWTYKLVHPSFERESIIYRYIIKMPSILADLGAAVAIFFLLRRLRNTKTGLWGALVWTVHPVVWFDSAVWGQTDILFTLLSFLAVVALARDRLWLGGVLVALVMLTKVQGVIFMPLFLILAAQRPLRSWRFLVSGMLVTFLVTLPFLATGNLTELIGVYRSSVGFYPTLSFMAYNFWWSMFLDASSGTQDSNLLWGIMTYRHAALGTVAVFYALILWRLQRVLWSSKLPRVRMEAALAAAALCALAFFLFSTQMHERYVFPVFIFGVPLVFQRREYAVPFTLASISAWFNLAGILPFSPLDKGLFATFPGWDAFMASLLVFVFFQWLVRALRLSLKPLCPLPWRLWRSKMLRAVKIRAKAA